MKRFQLTALLILGMLLCLAPTVSAVPIDLSITGAWTADDFTVTGVLDPSYDSTNPKFDGMVHGVSPSAGSTTVQLLVETAGAVSFSAGHSYDYNGTTYTLSHDWYGYSDVTLVNTPFTFGTATWSGSMVNLDGPGGTQLLWTNQDLTVAAPSLLSFRMFGSGNGLSADIFFGSRTPQTIGSQFLLWEYYKGEEIRNNNYSASVGSAPVPEPATIFLFSFGLIGLAGFRRKFKK